MNALTDAINAQQAGQIEHLPLLNLHASPTNPRKRFNIDSLIESIRQHGVLQPILVRQVSEGQDDDSEYEIIAGERRYRAARAAGLDTIPAFVRNIPDEQIIEIQLIENIQRNDLTELEEGECYHAMIHQHGYTADQIGERIGKSRRHVYARIELCDLCPAVRADLDLGKLNASVAQLIARIPVPSLQEQAAKDILQGDPNTGDALSVRAAAALIQQRYMLEMRRAKWPLSDVFLVPTAGSCDTCPKRTSINRDRFEDIRADVCTDPDCFAGKQVAFIHLRRASFEQQGHTVIHGDDATRLLDDAGKATNFYADTVALDDTRLRARITARIPDTAAALLDWLGDDINTVRDILASDPHAVGKLPRTFIENASGDIIECVSLKALLDNLVEAFQADNQQPDAQQTSLLDEESADDDAGEAVDSKEQDATPSHNDNQLDSPKNAPHANSNLTAIRNELHDRHTALLTRVRDFFLAGHVPDLTADTRAIAILLCAHAGDFFSHNLATDWALRWGINTDNVWYGNGHRSGASIAQQIANNNLTQPEVWALILDTLILTCIDNDHFIDSPAAPLLNAELDALLQRYTTPQLEPTPTPVPAAQAPSNARKADAAKPAKTKTARPTKPAAQAQKAKPDQAPAKPAKSKAKPIKQAAVAAKDGKTTPKGKSSTKKAATGGAA